MSGLYHRSLQDISQQEKRGGGRSSPYTRPSPSSRPSSDDRWQHDRFNASSAREGNSRIKTSEAPTQKLLVEGLHYEIGNAELEGLFQQIGPTEKCFIRFDRSGRSTGTATVIYKQVSHAAEARREYDGANAKGRPIKITYEIYREFQPRSAGAPPPGHAATGKGRDLMSRLGSGDLSTRLGGGPARLPAPANAPRRPAAETAHSRPGPERTISGDGRGRGGGFPRQRGSGRGRGGRAGRDRGPPPTASNLDAELDAFMKAPTSSDKAPEADVDMS